MDRMIGRPMRFVIFVQAIVAVLATSAIDWHPSNLILCHEERLERAHDMWPNLAHYHAADRVAPRLWVGSVCAAMNETFRKENHIRLVLSVADEWPFQGSQDDIVYKHVPGLRDSTYEDVREVKTRFSIAAAMVHAFFNDPSNAHASALIYCNMGVSRSSSVAIRVIMQRDGQPFEPVFEAVKTARPIVAPNALYRHILSTFDKDEL